MSQENVEVGFEDAPRHPSASCTDRTNRIELFREECPSEEEVGMKVRSAVLMSAVAAAAVIAGCGDTAGDEQTLTYTEGRGEFTPIGGATERRTPPGGGFTISVPLEDDSGSRAGELNAVCVATQESSGFPRTATCSGAADLPDGQLALNITGKIREDVTGSIVGGTGDYEGATGTFESTGGEQPTDTFTFTLP
jgi:hypothetical protein